IAPAGGSLQKLFEIPVHQKNRRPQRHYQYRGEDQEEHWKDHLHGNLPGGLLSALPETDAKILRVPPQRRRKTRAESIGVEQKLAHFPESRCALALRSPPNALAAPFAGRSLRVPLAFFSV